MNGETTPANPIAELPAPEPLPVKKKPVRKASTQVQDLSHIFMLRAFAQSLEERATEMLSLAENLKIYANRKEMMESFAEKFPQKK